MDLSQSAESWLIMPFSSEGESQKIPPTQPHPPPPPNKCSLKLIMKCFQLKKPQLASFQINQIVVESSVKRGASWVDILMGMYD